MAQSSLKLTRPWASYVRHFFTSASMSKEAVIHRPVVVGENTEKSNSSSSNAAGEEYFSGLINDLQDKNVDSTPDPRRSTKVDDQANPNARPRMTQAMMNQSLRSHTQKLMAEQKWSDGTLRPEAFKNVEESKVLATAGTPPVAVDEPENEMLSESSVENVRMTLAGMTHPESPPRATFASVPPPNIPFSQILCSLQTTTENRNDQNFDVMDKLVVESSKTEESSATEKRVLIGKTNALAGYTEEQQIELVSEKSMHSAEQSSLPVDDVAPVFGPSFNFAAYVERSESLQELVKLGVDLSVWEKRKGVPEYILRLDFARDMKDHIRFLCDMEVPPESLGHVLTKNPFLFKEKLQNLDIRINYLKSKRFTNDAIATIFVKSPYLLNVSSKIVDERLGYLQQLFALTGDEVRDVITRLPKLVTARFAVMQQMHFTMLEEFGFSPEELKTIFMTKPKIWLASRHAIQERFDYLHVTMGMSHELLTLFPGALLCRKFIFMQRHLYLKHIGRAQYDPTKANYVSLKALVTGTDSVFCSEVSKTPVQQFNDFLKTL